MIKKRLVYFLKSGVSISLIILLLFKLNWNQIIHLQPYWAALSILLFFLNIVISTLRWKIILQALGVKISYTFLWYVYMSSIFWNSFLPTTIGGDGYRFFTVSGKFPHISKKVIASSLLIDRITGFIALGLVHFSFFFYYFNLLATRNPTLLYIELLIGFGWSASISLTLFFLKKPALQKIKSLKWSSKIQILTEGAKQINMLVFLQSIILSFLFVLISSTGIWIYYNMAGATIEWKYSIYLSTFSNFIGMLPISINGIGSTEWTIILAAQSFNINKNYSIFAMTLFRLFSTFFAALGGIIYFFFKHKYTFLKPTI